MREARPVNSTSKIIHVFCPDSSVSTGAGKTALAFGDITAYYVRAGGTLTAMTMETISTLGTWASTGNDKLGFKLLHDTNAPGMYELNLPDNILLAGADLVTIQLRATGMAPVNIGIPLQEAIIEATVDDTVAPSTTVFETSTITQATADHYIGRVIVFIRGVLDGQGTTINDYALNGGRGQFTVDQMTDAPVNGDVFRIY